MRSVNGGVCSSASVILKEWQPCLRISELASHNGQQELVSTCIKSLDDFLSLLEGHSLSHVFSLNLSFSTASPNTHRGIKVSREKGE